MVRHMMVTDHLMSFDPQVTICHNCSAGIGGRRPAHTGCVSVMLLLHDAVQKTGNNYCQGGCSYTLQQQHAEANNADVHFSRCYASRHASSVDEGEVINLVLVMMAQEVRVIPAALFLAAQRKKEMCSARRTSTLRQRKGPAPSHDQIIPSGQGEGGSRGCCGLGSRWVGGPKRRHIHDSIRPF